MDEMPKVELAELLRGSELRAQLAVAVIKDEVVVAAAAVFRALEASVGGGVAVTVGLRAHAVPRRAVAAGHVALRAGGAVAALLVEGCAVVLVGCALPARRGRNAGLALTVVQRADHDGLVDVVFAELDEHFLPDTRQPLPAHAGTHFIAAVCPTTDSCCPMRAPGQALLHRRHARGGRSCARG